MKKQNLLALIVLALFFLLSCQDDKGDTEKFIGTWKVESYICNGEQLMSNSKWVSGILKISDNYFQSNFDTFNGFGSKNNLIFYPTNEKWVASNEYVLDERGQIRMGKGSSVKLNIWGNMNINGIYELQGNNLVIKGTESGGRLHHIILTRYSY